MAVTTKLPNPREEAQRQADSLRDYPASHFQAHLKRILMDAPFVDADALVAGLEEFHQERMERIPSAAEYPESPAWVAHILAVDREFQQITGLSNREMALHRSLGAFLTFRGYAAARPVTAEKCRVAYLPESERGQIHIKNVDDPATCWKAVEPVPDFLTGAEDLSEDGSGSGLHLDDEPEEIFPLDVRAMRSYYANDVPGAIEFYARYKFFWGGGNVVIHDREKRSAAIEKCSHNFIEVFHPGPDGRSHCSGMVCRDPNSPQGRYQREKRQQYLRAFGLPDDGPDQLFWDACDRAERMLAECLESLAEEPKLDDVLKVFCTPWPEGLRKDGLKVHPDQADTEYTLVTRCSLIDEKKLLRWQRDPESLRMPAEPETIEF